MRGKSVLASILAVSLAQTRWMVVTWPALLADVYVTDEEVRFLVAMVDLECVSNSVNCSMQLFEMRLIHVCP
jgi:hypothetical protein